MQCFSMKSDFPMWKRLELELISFCNRDCAFCPRYNDRSGVRKDKIGHKILKNMPTAKVYYIIDQASKLDFRGEIGFHRLSEGLLDPRWAEFAVYAKSKGMKVADATNGDVLKRDLDLCYRLDGIVDRFTIGLYDYQSFHEYWKERSFWKKRFKKTKIEFSAPLEYPTLRQGSEIDFLKKKQKTLNLPCFRTTDKFLIRYDGEVSLCCEDDGCNFNLGNVFDQSMEEIWWSDKHINIIKELQKPGGRHTFDLCSNCYIKTGKMTRFIEKVILSNLKRITKTGQTNHSLT